MEEDRKQREIIQKRNERKQKERKREIKSEMIRKRDIVSKRNEENKELKHYEGIQNREDKNEDDFDMGWFSKIATSDNELFVDSLNLHEIRNEILGD